MSPKKLLLSIFYGTISGVIAAWLVLKVLESKGCGPKGTHEEIRDEQNDRDNPADKLPEENDERLDKKAEEHEEMH